MIKRLENSEKKMYKKIDFRLKKIEDLKIKLMNNKISKKEYNLKKKNEEESIKKIKNKLRNLMGEVAKRKRTFEEKNNQKRIK